jgi:hypothetical protein
MFLEKEQLIDRQNYYQDNYDDFKLKQGRMADIQLVNDH